MRDALPGEADLARLYDGLARYQWWRRRLDRASAGAGLEMHKRLRAPVGDGPAAGSAALNGWLWKRLDPPATVRVLDIGCGFGATMLDWARRAPQGVFVGLTLSGYQVRVANREARRAGLAERCTFRVQSFDAPIDAPADVVVSIETLFHAPVPADSLRRLARNLSPGGVLVLVEDMARDVEVEQEDDGKELLARWSTSRLHGADGMRGAVSGAGLDIVEDVDLTAQVPRRSLSELEADRRRLERIRRFVPLAGVRRIVDAFLGGLALERLYARDRMTYRMLRARKRGEDA